MIYYVHQLVANGFCLSSVAGTVAYMGLLIFEAQNGNQRIHWPEGSGIWKEAVQSKQPLSTWPVSTGGRQTATPGLLLMMRADVRLVSMNIDVEDSLFHRRTEGGKMAAL